MRTVAVAALLLLLGCAPDAPITPTDFVDADVSAGQDAAVLPGKSACMPTCDTVECEPFGSVWDDKNPCTIDACTGFCFTNTWIPGCCVNESECGDGDPCTYDSCIANQCQHAPPCCN